MELDQLNDVAADLQTAECPISNPNNGAYLFTLILAGPTHPATVAHDARMNRALALQSKRLGNFMKALNARAEEALTDPDERLSREVDALLARTVGWRDVTDNGAPVAYDAKQMETLYRSRKWLRDTVQTFLADIENFTGKVPTN